MRAIVLDETGPAENLALRNVDTPAATEGHVVVRVHACGVGYRDVIERRGGHPFMRTPIIQGHEFAGEVVEVGRGVRRWRVGDRVVNLYTDSCGACEECLGGDERRCRNMREAFGLTVDGGYAEYALAAERALEALPEGIDWPVAATLLSAVGVGFHNTVHTAKVGVGDHVLVTGASGGVGLAALQTARLMRATVWAVTGSEAKRARLAALGADHVLVDDAGRFHKELLAERDGRGVDAVIDCVGSPTLNASLRSLRPYGRVVVVGNVDTSSFQLNPGLLAVNALQLLGSDNVTRASLRQVMALVADGELTPRIERRLPLDQAAEAHRLLEARANVGRLVLEPGR